MIRRSTRTAGIAAAVAVGAALLAAPLAPTQAAPTPAAAPAVDFRPSLVTVDTPTRGAKQRLQKLGLDLTEHAGHDYVEVVLHSPADVAALVEHGFTYDVRVSDLVARDLQRIALDEAFADRVAVSGLPSGRTGYRTITDFNKDMIDLHEKYPRIAKTFKLPRPTLDGRVVRGIELGKNVRRPNTGQPTFLLMGLHHAREWPSGELAMEFAIDLAQSYGKNKRVTRLLDNARIVVVPVVNVDGYYFSRRDGDYLDLREVDGGGTGAILGSPGRVYMRKNCRIVDGQDTPDGACYPLLATPGGFGHGTDLNRNYGGFWGGPGADTMIAGPTYRGAEPFSEPETQNIRDLVRTRQMTMVISNHTFSNLVLRPNGVNPTTIGADGLPVGNAPDEEALKDLGKRMTDQNGYANIHGWQLYDTTGTTEDYTYNATGGFGYTFEIGPNEFHPPFEQVVDEYVGAGKFKGKGNRGAYLIAFEHALDQRYSGVLKGRAKPGTTLRLAKKFVSPTWESGFDDFVDTTMTVPANGRFSWIVNPSTRPVVRPRTFSKLADKPFRTTEIEGSPAAPNGHTDHEFVIPAGGKKTGVLTVDLDWPTPDDLDLEVYKMVGDGLQEVGSSGNQPGSKESVSLTDPTPGTYVFRVINFSSVSPSYTLTTGQFETQTRTTTGKRETYTFTCERQGKVVGTAEVFIDRGQVKTLDVKGCRA